MRIESAGNPDRYLCDDLLLPASHAFRSKITTKASDIECADLDQSTHHIRSRTQMSQAVFAAVLDTGVSTVQKWETGEKRPSVPSLKLLNVIERKRVKGPTWVYS